MRISLDWDKISRKTANKRCKRILKIKYVFQIDLYKSPMGKGYHCYVYFIETELLKDLNLIIRSLLWDDKKRLHLDQSMRDKEPSVLFCEKHIGNKVYKEKFIRNFIKACK
jgi:hypothetical protein